MARQATDKNRPARFPTEEELDWLRKIGEHAGEGTERPPKPSAGDKHSLSDVESLVRDYTTTRRYWTRNKSMPPTWQVEGAVGAAEYLDNDELVTALDAKVSLESARYYMRKMGSGAADVLKPALKQVREEIKRLTAETQAAQSDRENAIHRAWKDGQATWPRHFALRALNGYVGDNIWGDLIYRMRDYNKELTKSLGRGEGGDYVALFDGTMLRRESDGEWVSAGTVAEFRRGNEVAARRAMKEERS